LLVMSKQQQAPGELEHVRAFVNTADFEEGTEAFGTATGLAAWLVQRGLAPSTLRATRRDLSNAIELREALRAILLGHTDASGVPVPAGETLDKAACRARLRLRFGEEGAPALEPEAGGVDGALGRLLAIVDRAIAQGAWERLKACRLHTCEWAFYDHTKNHSGAWCSMDVCGNRAKARAYRERVSTVRG
jgi:predicted RNA-binding Zn ribbon-like protein